MASYPKKHLTGIVNLLQHGPQSSGVCRCTRSVVTRSPTATRPMPARRSRIGTHPRRCGRSLQGALMPMLQGTDRITGNRPRPRSGGTSTDGTHRTPPPHHAHRRSSGPSHHRRLCCPAAQPVLRPPPTPTRPAARFPGSPVIGRHAPATYSAGHRAGEGLPSSRRHPRYVPRPIRRGVLHGCASRLFAASMAFAPISRGSALPCPARRRMSNDAAGFASCYGPHRRSPIRASDAGLRPRPFPGETASLLPGLLAATRTGLTPAGDDELTNTKKHHGITSRCHPLLYWAHKKTSVKAPTTRSDSGKVPGSTWTTRCVRYVIDVALP